jgi:NitT/TauT family transport system permease protein
LPSPGKVLTSIVDLFVKHEIISDIKISFYRVMAGFLFAAILSLPIGILMGSFKEFEALFEPFNDLIRYMPVPAFIPLIILWVGIGNMSQISLIFIGTFFQLVLMVADDVAHTPKEYIEVSKTLGLSKTKVLFHVILPYSLPYIYDDMRIAVGWAWSYLVLAEIVGANKGIGHVIMEAQRFLKTDTVIAGIVIIGIIGLTVDYIFKAFYRNLFRWTEK